MSGKPSPSLALPRRALLGTSVLGPLAWLLSAEQSRAEPGLALAAAAEPAHGGLSRATSDPGKRVLVCVFLRGAADSLNVVVPHGDPEYYRARPSIAVPRPGSTGGALDLDGQFGLHPRLAPLKAAYDARELALVHAVGSPHPTRSHFEAQDYMETGAVGVRSATQGWLARYLALRPAAESAQVRAVGLSARGPLSLRGYPDAVVAPSLKEFRLIASDRLAPVLRQGLRKLYGAAPQLAARSGLRALEMSELIARIAAGNYRPEHGASYAREGQAFADVARIIKADVGLEVAWIDVPGWDTHRQQGSSDKGELPKALDRLGRALGAFRTDLGQRFEHVVVLVMSEFGRTVLENGTGGTDHGHGGAMLVLGGNVNGGRVLGDFPGLSEHDRHDGRDLKVTTDFREVVAGVVEDHLGLPDSRSLFPGFTLAPDSQRRLALLR